MESTLECVKGCICEGCNPLLADALIAFASSKKPSHTTRSRRWSIWTLFSRHVSPVFVDLMKAGLEVDTGFRVPSFSPKEFTLLISSKDSPLAGDDFLRRIHRHATDDFRPCIETMRNFLFYLKGCGPKRGVPSELRFDLGAPKRRLHRASLPGGHDGTYCTLCWRLTAHAINLEKSRETYVDSPSSGRILWASELFCEEHNPSNPRSSYRRDHAYAEDLGRAYKRLWGAINRNDLWVRVHDRVKKTSAAALQVDFNRPRSSYSPVVSYLRWWAYCVVRFRPSERTIRAKQLELHGLSQAGIARELGVSRQAVSRMLRNAQGIYNFTSPDPILVWEPDLTRSPSFPTFTFPGEASGL